MFGSLPRFALLTLLSSLLVACGGGGGSSSAPSAPGGAAGGGTGGGTTNPPTLVLEILDAAGVATNNVNGTTPVTLRATLKDGNGDAIVGQVVSFTSDVGQLSPATGNQLTVAGGISEVSLGAGTVADAGEAKATATINSVVIDSNIIGIQSDGQGSGGTSNSLTAVMSLTSPDNSVTISRDNIGTVSITVTDASGAAVNNAVVTFTASNGVLNPLAGAVSTNAAGVASVTLLAGTASGAGVLNATVTLGAATVAVDPVNFVSAGDAFATINLSIPSGASNTTVTNAAPQTVTATVIDSAGSAVQGAIVTFTRTGSGGVLSSSTDVTNATGQATTNILPGTVAAPGEISASTSVGGVAVSTPANGAISFSSTGDGPFNGTGSSNLNIALSIVNGSGQPLTGAIEASNPGILQALVTDANNNALSGIVVEFVSGGIGDLFPVNGLALTNATGIASVALNAGSQPGAGQATATIVINSAKFNADSLTFQTLGNAGNTPIVLTLVFTDATPSNGTNIITSQDNATVVISVKDDTGSNLPNRTASITASLGTSLNVAGGTPASTITATSDADGKVNVTLTAGATFGTGDFVVTVGDATETLQFDVGVAGLQIGTCSGGVSTTDCGAGTTFTAGGMAIATSPLSAGGTSTVSLVVADTNSVVVPNIDIGFSSTCSGQVEAGTTNPLASITQTATSNTNGVISATYQASGCSGNDIITATESSTGQTATGTINILPPTIGSIVFDAVNNSAGTPITDIFIQESGGESTARVVFQVLDVFGNPAKDEDVNFTLTSTVGGIALQNATGLTDTDGKATAFLNSGFIATTVRVRASIDIDTDNNGVDDTTLVTLSGSLSVNTGIADQNSFSLSTTIFNIEGLGFDGINSNYTVRMADRFNNPVPDGTSVQFRTELGRIEPSCTTTNGNCSVTLNSQEPRGPLNPATIVRNLDANSCPTPYVVEEAVTIAAGVGLTQYTASSILRVESAADVNVTNFTSNADGIVCSGAGTCADGAALKITYLRTFLDEDIPVSPAIAASHVISAPGQATAPFRGRTGIPCASSFSNQQGISSGYRGGLGQYYGGRSTILAFAQGEESFVDTNGNGLYDFNEPFVDLTEVFHDYNEDRVFGNGTVGSDDSRDVSSRTCYGPTAPIANPNGSLGNCYQTGGDEEEFIDFGVAATLNNKFDAGNGIYNGTLCPKAISDRTATCNNGSDACVEATDKYCTRELVNVSKSAVLALSGSSPRTVITDSATSEIVNSVFLGNVTTPGNYKSAGSDVISNNGATINAGTEFSVGTNDGQVMHQIGDSVLLTGGGAVNLRVRDINNNPMPAGTSVTITAGSNGCLISNTPSFVIGDGLNVPDSTLIALTVDSTKASGNDVITITISTPQSLTEVVSFNCQF